MALSYRRATTYPTKYHGALIQPTILVVHSTEGVGRTYLDGLFSGKYPRKNADGSSTAVSVHWCIYKNGDIVEYAPWTKGNAVRCSHAGESVWQGRAHCNGFSLGVEVEHVLGVPYPEVQIEALCELCRMVKSEYPSMALVTHKEIAPGRKIDPTKPWDEFKDRVYSAWEEEAMSVDHSVGDHIAEPYKQKLKEAGLLNNPELHDGQDVPDNNAFYTMIGRLAEKAGLLE